jgi:hypothetical protein
MHYCGYGIGQHSRPQQHPSLPKGRSLEIYRRLPVSFEGECKETNPEGAVPYEYWKY